jgi:hypothetical protein
MNIISILYCFSHVMGFSKFPKIIYLLSSYIQSVAKHIYTLYSPFLTLRHNEIKALWLPWYNKCPECPLALSRTECHTWWWKQLYKQIESSVLLTSWHIDYSSHCPKNRGLMMLDPEILANTPHICALPIFRVTNWALEYYCADHIGRAV